MNTFLVALLNIIQQWTQAVGGVAVPQNNDRITGLLLYLGLTLNALATGQPLPDPNGVNPINPLVNFWQNINALFNPGQNPQIAGVIAQGFITQNTITGFLLRADQPTATDIVAVLKAIVGLMALQNQSNDIRYRWALFFLLFWTISFGIYNPQDANDLYNYLFLNGPKPQKVAVIADPVIARLLPAGGGWQGGQPFGNFWGLNGGCCGGCGQCGQNPFFLPQTCGQKCPDIFWHCNSADPCCCDCIQQRPPCCCQNTWDCDDDCDDDNDDCAFPKAVCFLFERLGQQAKKLLQCQGHVDWCQLGCVLKKMLILGMFVTPKKTCKNKKCCKTGQQGCQCGCKKTKSCQQRCPCNKNCGCGNCQGGGWRW